MGLMVVCLIIHAEMLLAGITFGTIVINMLDKKQRELLTRANKSIIAISIIVFMVLIGSTLDIFAILSVVVLISAMIYIVARATGKITGVMIGGKLAHAEPAVQKYLGMALLAAAGISLTFVGIASAVLPEDTAVKMASVIAATALINEVIAVFATKRAFRKAGEIGKAETSKD